MNQRADNKSDDDSEDDAQHTSEPFRRHLASPEPIRSSIARDVPVYPRTAELIYKLHDDIGYWRDSPSMQKAEEYRREAEKCRDMAARETNPGAKASLLELARKYEALAAKHDEFRELQEEIRATKERDAD